MSRFAALFLPIMLILAACAPAEPEAAEPEGKETAQGMQRLAVTGWLEGKAPERHAHWISRERLLVPDSGAAENWVLLSLPPDGGEMSQVPLKPETGGGEWQKAFPHLAGFSALAPRNGLPRVMAVQMLREQTLLAGIDGEGQLVALSRLQIPGVLDDLYTSGADDADEIPVLGADVRDRDILFTVWAPTAQKVDLLLFDENKNPLGTRPMIRDEARGSFQVTTEKDLQNAFYLYEVALFHPESGKEETLRVTDPYSLSLSTDSAFSQAVDLDDPATRPANWGQARGTTVNRPEELIIYEAHIGDFSGTDETVPLSARGKYTAFSESDSAGVAHLKRLRAAGLNVFHLLPTYDLGSIPERPENQARMRDTVDKACRLAGEPEFCAGVTDREISLQALLESYDPATGEAQRVIEAIDEVDDYNWGYDPWHYTVPEGSYAQDPDGISRIVEFRQMVESLHALGFRVVMDVVYNHTFQSGLDEKSVLDKIVPGYYHRLDPLTGKVEQSTCCENTATEHRMMAKLMMDSLVVWARDYHIDGFRFDLMGHQPRQAMLQAREAVRKVDPDTYFYGEGWDFGEVAGNARFRQATQTELGGTEIGTFTDRLRDAVRGGSSFVDGDDLRKGQGVGSGLPFFLNDLNNEEGIRETYHLYLDQVRLGLAANLAEYEVLRVDGEKVAGRDIPYGGAPAGYAKDPADTINYVSKHDNQTLWDNNQYRIPFEASSETRARMQSLGLSYAIYAQGVPFLHMGSEFLRSKSFLRDSFNYGHWFNAVDFEGNTNNYFVGLPPAQKDKANWPLILRLHEENEGRDQVSADILEASSARFMDMIAVRTSSPLFSLPDAEAITARVKFLNAGPDQKDGLIVMLIEDGTAENGLDDLDPAAEALIVVFNHSPQARSFQATEAVGMTLHPRLAESPDPVTRQSRVEGNRLTVPGWTTAVFVRLKTK